MSTQPASADEAPLSLNILCTPHNGAWRIYIRPTKLPKYLVPFFGQHFEAYPGFLDFEELDRRIKKRGLGYEKRVTRLGDVEITADGDSAREVAIWLSTAFTSGVQRR